MKEFDYIIRNLSLDEKIELLVSNEKDHSSRLKNYDLPHIDIKSDNKVFLNPGYETNVLALASTFDPELISDYYYETRFNNTEVWGFYLNPKNVNFDFNALYLARALQGISSASDLGAIADFPGDKVDDEKLFNDTFLKPLNPIIKKDVLFLVKTNSSSNIRRLREVAGYKGIVFAELEEGTAVDVLKALYEGANIVYTSKNVTKDISKAVAKYREELLKYNSKDITLLQFQQMEDSGEIVSEAKLDGYIENYLSLLMEMKEKHDAKDVIQTEGIKKRLADESIVVLKNDGILPIKLENTIGVFCSDSFKLNCNDIVLENFLDVLKDYDIKVVGAVNGVSDDLNNDDPLATKMINLANECNYALVMVNEMNDKRLSLIRKLSEINPNVIVVLNSTKEIRIDFKDDAKGIILLNESNDLMLNSLVEVIMGATCPSGRTPRPIFSTSGNIAFPFGMGESYADFEYYDYKLTNKGLEFFVRSHNEFAANEVALLYIGYEHSERLANFVRISLKAKDTTKVIIPFDELSFAFYNVDARCYEIPNMPFEIKLYASGMRKQFEMIVSLEARLLTNRFEDKYNLTVEEDYDMALDEFTSAENDIYVEERRNLSLGARVGVFLIGLLVIEGILGGLFYITFSYERKLSILCFIILGLMGLSFIFLLIYLIIAIKNRNNNAYLEYERLKKMDELTKVMDEYEELDKVVYERVKEDISLEQIQEEIEPVEVIVSKEVKEEAKEEEAEPEPEEVILEEADSNIVFKFDASLEDIPTDEEIEELEVLHAVYEDLKLDEALENFNDYALNKGLIVEPSSARLLFSTIPSVKAMILNTADKELLIPFIEALYGYLELEFESISLKDVKNFREVIWEQIGEDTYGLSRLSNLLIKAASKPNELFIITLTDVNLKTLPTYFRPLLNYIKNPNNGIKVNLGTEDSPQYIKLRDNILFIITSEDSIDDIPASVANITSYLDLLIRKNEIINPDYEEKHFKFTTKGIRDTLSKLKESNYVKEDVWKKFDSVEDKIDDKADFHINNRLTLDIEKIIAILLEYDADIEEICDDILASKFIPVLKSSKIYNATNGDASVLKIIENVFGDDNIELTKRVIRKSE